MWKFKSNVKCKINKNETFFNLSKSNNSNIRVFHYKTKKKGSCTKIKIVL